MADRRKGGEARARWTATVAAVVVLAASLAPAGLDWAPPAAASHKITEPGSLPDAMTGTSSVWDSSRSKLYVFGGYGPCNGGASADCANIWEWKPGDTKATKLSVGLPSGRHFTSAVWDSKRNVAYVIGGNTCGPCNGQVDAIVKFDPAGPSVSQVGTMPEKRGGTSAVYVPSEDRVYIFGGLSSSGGQFDTVLRFNPGDGSVAVQGGDCGGNLRLRMPLWGTTAVWAGSEAYIFGGSYQGTARTLIHTFVPPNRITPYPTDLPCAAPINALPGALNIASSAWDGSAAYIFGGSSTQLPADGILKYVPGQGTTQLSLKLPSGRDGTSAAWDGSKYAYIVGGSGPLDDILRWNPNNRAPVARIAAIPASIECVRGETVALDGSGTTDADGDPLTYRWSVTAGGGSVQDPAAASTRGTFDVGDHGVRLEVHDEEWVASHTGTATATFAVRDTVAPVSTLALNGTSGNAGWWRSAVTADLSATDACSTPTTHFAVDGGAFQQGSKATISGDGSHTLQYHARDAAGNQEATKSRALPIDATPPVTPPPALAGTPGENGWFISDVAVTLAPTDATSGVARTQHRLGSGALQTGTSLTVTMDGNHTLTFFSEDRAGNVEAQRTARVPRDTVPPATTPGPAGTRGNLDWWITPVDLTLAAADATSGVARTRWNLDNAGWLGSSAIPVTVAIRGDGDHAVQFLSEDHAGHAEAVRSAAFRIDATPPATTAAMACPLGDNGWCVGPADVAFRATDALSGVASTHFRVGSGAEQTGLSFTIAQDGVHAVTYFSRDVAGGTGPAKSLTVRKDTVPPATTAKPNGTAGDNGWFRSDVTVDLQAVDATSGVARTYFQVDGDGFRQGTSVTVAQEGVYLLQYYSVDLAGNTEPVRSFAVKVDKTAPTLDVEAPRPGRLYLFGQAVPLPSGGAIVVVGDLTVLGDASDALSGVSRVEFRLDGALRRTDAAPPAWSWDWPASAEGLGSHRLDVIAYDVAGNAAARSATITVVPTAPGGVENSRCRYVLASGACAQVDPVLEGLPGCRDLLSAGLCELLGA